MIHSLKRSFSFSKNVKVRVQWFDYFKQTQNVSQTCKHFSISRKTFYKWKKRYDPFNLFTLEDISKAPKNKRQPQISYEQEKRIIALRKRYMRYSKIKLAILYQNQKAYQKEISSLPVRCTQTGWQIQRTIQKYKLYLNLKRPACYRKRSFAGRREGLIEF